MKRTTSVVLALFLVVAMLLTFGCGQKDSGSTETPETDETVKLKVAYVIPGSINDAGWCAIAYDALKAIEANFGAETSYAENVPTSDFEERYRAYAEEGYNVIIGHGFEFGDVAMKVARDYPDIKFIVTSTDISQEPNVASVQTNNYVGGYVVGAIAGIVTETNKVAYVGGMDIPSITNAGKGFIKGAKAVNPEVEAFETYTGDFHDVTKAKEVMESFLEKGVDVGVGNADFASLGPIEACKNKGAKVVGIIGNQNDVAPDNVVGSIEYSYVVALQGVMQDILDGKFEAKFYNSGFKEGALIFYPNDKVITLEQKAKVEDIIKQIVDGTLKVD
jgi:basic membrane protein A